MKKLLTAVAISGRPLESASTDLIESPVPLTVGTSPLIPSAANEYRTRAA